jgi:FkbM family methyltransferase
LNVIPKLPSDTLSVELLFAGSKIEYRLYSTDDLADVIGFNWIYEPEVIGAILNLVGEDDLCIDAGACLGYHSLLMSRMVGQSGAVMAFEPDPPCQKKMAANIELNKISNIHLMPIPLLDKAAFYTFCSYPKRCGYSSFAMQYSDQVADKITLKTNYLDNIFDDKCQIKLLKIDCEGVEEKVLLGTERLLKRGIDYVIVEFNFKIMRMYGLSERLIFEFMAAMGYNCFLLYQSGLPPALLPYGYDFKLEGERFHYNFMFSRQKEFLNWLPWSHREPIWLAPYGCNA